mmetsp:Transcript_51808/g.150671  ORF Transcript_51808/g.150671 Transcript_51808/m.150671 type:complete len:242 (-) Transcript_51808:3592-4317(-)
MCLPTPPAATTCPTHELISWTVCDFSRPTVIMIMFRSDSCRSARNLVTIWPREFSGRLPRSSPSVRQTSHFDCCLASLSSLRHVATASKKQVPPATSGFSAASVDSRDLRPLALTVNGAKVSTREPKPTKPTASPLWTCFCKMRCTQAEHVAKRDMAVPVSCDIMEQLRSRQKIIARSVGAAARGMPLPRGMATLPMGLRLATRFSGAPRSRAWVATRVGSKPGSCEKAASISLTVIQRIR